MGLDMHLTGELYLPQNYEDDSKNIVTGGFRLKAQLYDLGYWRKHPDLHGFIVETFADGSDECQRIYLDATDLATIIEVIRQNRLPHTEGFFFGESVNDAEQQLEAIGIFSKALEWLDAGDWAHSVYYQASW